MSEIFSIEAGDLETIITVYSVLVKPKIYKILHFAWSLTVNCQIELLTDEQLLSFFNQRKKDISCIEQPNIFLTQLRDHNLLPETLFQAGECVAHSRAEAERSLRFWTGWGKRDLRTFVVSGTVCILRLLMDILSDAEGPLDAEMLTKESKGAVNKGKEKKDTRKKSKDGVYSEDSDDPGTSSASNVTPKKKAKKSSFSSPVKTDNNQEIWMFPKYKTELPVKCGNTEGTLHRDKLANGEKCLFAQGRWFSPGEFEKFAGKERSKNWKVSIRCEGTPLKKLIEANLLQCKPMQRKQGTSVRKSKKVQIVISSSEDSSPDSRPYFSGGGSQFRSRVDDDEEEDEMVDLTVFQAHSLRVTCVSLTGTLYKKRFATGKRGKSIRTEERWFTPEEFVKEEPTLSDGFWKKDIRCHGKTLNFLCEKKILQIHSVLCECGKCSTDPKDLADQNNDDVCFACHSEGDLVCCDECPRAFHEYCHLPPVPKDASGEWICTFCMIRKKQQLQSSSNTTEQEV
ncbi:uncharacterized protein sp100.2 isoform X3 [Danio rerio]|uniref:Uncharacterized protein sp100.2 isoform X3 n=1 Tax=Danio rerio TaxID=7955 RepID=A0AC58J1Y5_DANRE